LLGRSVVPFVGRHKNVGRRDEIHMERAATVKADLSAHKSAGVNGTVRLTIDLTTGVIRDAAPRLQREQNQFSGNPPFLLEVEKKIITGQFCEFFYVG